MSFEFVVSGNTNASKPLPWSSSLLLSWLCFYVPQVLLTTTPTFCMLTMICLVQTASRSSLNGRHISKHCCHSGAMRVPNLFFIFSPIFFFFSPSGPLAALWLGSICWQGGGEGRVRGTVRQRCGPPLCWVCRTPDPVPSQAAPVSSSNRVHYGSASSRHRARTTASGKQISFRFGAEPLVTQLPQAADVTRRACCTNSRGLLLPTPFMSELYANLL